MAELNNFSQMTRRINWTEKADERGCAGGGRQRIIVLNDSYLCDSRRLHLTAINSLDCIIYLDTRNQQMTIMNGSERIMEEPQGHSRVDRVQLAGSISKDNP